MINDVAICVSNDNKNINAYQTINYIKQAGFKKVFVQWYNKAWEPSQEYQLKKCIELGLEVIFCHLGKENIDKIWEDTSIGDEVISNYKADLETLSKFNIPMVILHIERTKIISPKTQIGITRLKNLLAFAKQKNIVIALENVKDNALLEFIFENIDDDFLKICYDSGHDHYFTNDNFNFEKFNNKIVALHLNDNNKSSDQHLIPYDGTVDWNLKLNRLKSVNYNNTFTCEACYMYDYLNISPKKFYKLAYKRTCKLAMQYKKIKQA